LKLLQFGKKSVILVSLPQGLFIPTVTALYFAGALKTKCSHYGSISHNNKENSVMDFQSGWGEF
jgi:hypothetical protein